MRVHEINPLEDERWPQFLEKHSLATVFHTAEWLDALRRTYGYRASALTTSRPGETLPTLWSSAASKAGSRAGEWYRSHFPIIVRR